jgi:hypothetical protein
MVAGAPPLRREQDATVNRHLALGTAAMVLACLLLQPVIAVADPPPHAHHHDPRRDHVVADLPPHSRVVHLQGARHYYSHRAVLTLVSGSRARLVLYVESLQPDMSNRRSIATAPCRHR